jgi:hypothetical protein
VRRFLDALGVPAERIPVDLDAQYRSRLAGKRMLVVLDNARDAEQVRPLLPGSGTALVVVTSRSQLTGLVAAEGAHPLTWTCSPSMRPASCWNGGLARAGWRPNPGPSSRSLAPARGCPWRWPIAAARAAQTGFPLTVLADARGRLGVLDAGDPATRVRAVFSWSYTTLSPPRGPAVPAAGPASRPGPLRRGGG